MRANRPFAVSALAVFCLAVAAPGVRHAPGVQQRPRFEASVSRVRVNVIVTDDEGRFVDDLRAADFRLYEDGELREVSDVQLVDIPAGSVTALGSGAADGAAGSPVPLVESDDQPAADDAVAAERFGAIVYFIDFTGLDHITQAHFSQRWESYLETKTTIAVPTAVYLVDQVGIVREITPLTTRLDDLRAAQQRVATTPLTRTYFGDALPEIATPPGTERLAAVDRQERFEEYDRSFYTFTLLAQFCDALAARAGRTALVWVSRGVTLRGTYQDRGYEPNSNLLRLQRRLHEAANSANVSIYAVDPRRYIDMLGGSAATPRAGSRGDELGITMRAAANETGGRHFIAWADFGEVVEEIELDSSRYYLLTYPATDARGDGDYHEIRVEVDRPGVSVRANQGYTDDSPEERRSRFVSAALTLPGTVNDLPVSAQAFRGAGGENETDVVVAVAVDNTPLGVQVGANGESVQQVEVHAVLLDNDDDMAVVAEMHRQVTAPAGEPRGAASGWLQSMQNWEIAPGSYDLRVMVIDAATGVVGTAQQGVDIPDADGVAWRAGDVMLVEIGADDTAVPVVNGRVRARSDVVATVEVRGGLRPVLDGAVRAVDQPASRGARLTSLPLRADGAIHRGTVRLPSLEAGEYVLELRVADTAAGNQRLYEVPVHVVPNRR